MFSDIEVGVIGSHVDLTYDYEYLGSSSSSLDDLLTDKGSFAEKLKNAKNPLIVVGIDAVKGPDGGAVLGKVQQLAEKLRANKSRNPGICISN